VTIYLIQQELAIYFYCTNSITNKTTQINISSKRQQIKNTKQDEIKLFVTGYILLYKFYNEQNSNKHKVQTRQQIKKT